MVSAGVLERGKYAYPPKVRILDTPGFADTRRPEQDALIATQVKPYIDSITTVLVLASGIVPRGAGGLHSALSILSTIFPDAMDNRVAFIFTNVSSPLHTNFCLGTIPEAFKDAPRFLLDNPIALQRKYFGLKGDPNMKNSRMEMRAVVKDREHNASQWLGGLERQRCDGWTLSMRRPGIFRPGSPNFWHRWTVRRQKTLALP